MNKFLIFSALLFVAFAMLSNGKPVHYDDDDDREIFGINATQFRDLRLKSSTTELMRQQLLKPSDYVFDFLHSKTGVTSGDGGETVAATAANFPALIGHGVAMTVGLIGPCGINLPHIHPRATEINIIIEGKFETGFFQENNAVFVMNDLEKGEATVFPQGAIHFEQNLNCDPARFVAAFNSEDPGVSTIATNFIGGLPANIVGASLGNLGISKVEDLVRYLPKNPALGIEECRVRCGLKH